AAQRAQAVAAERRQLGDLRLRFGGLQARLEAMSPLKVMTRGYSVAFRKADGHVVRAAAQVSVGDALAIRLGGEGIQQLADCDLIEAVVSGVSGRPAPR